MGPAGPAGPAGADGVDGVDGSGRPSKADMYRASKTTTIGAHVTASISASCDDPADIALTGGCQGDAVSGDGGGIYVIMSAPSDPAVEAAWNCMLENNHTSANSITAYVVCLR